MHGGPPEATPWPEVPALICVLGDPPPGAPPGSPVPASVYPAVQNILLTVHAMGLGSVLTLPRSDWATGIFAGDPREFWIRATVANGVLKLQSSIDGRVWPTLRLAAFPKAGRYLVGPMCCTPERAGLEVTFLDFRVGPPLVKGLHDLTY